MLLEFEFPTLKHKTMAEEFKKEFFDSGETVIHGSALFDQLEYEEWLDNTSKNRSAKTVREDWVIADTYFAVTMPDNRIVGMIDIRHNLKHSFLSNYGGHIGYSVRPTERKKGYATKMLGMALEYSKQLGLQKAMLGCYANNTASIRTICKCGGILTETKPYIDGRPMNVYWINLN